MTNRERLRETRNSLISENKFLSEWVTVETERLRLAHPTITDAMVLGALKEDWRLEIGLEEHPDCTLEDFHPLEALWWRKILTAALKADEDEINDLGKTQPQASRDAVAEFDARLARVRAEAWEEGYSWGWSDAADLARCDGVELPARKDWRLRTLNPYQQEGAE